MGNSTRLQIVLKSLQLAGRGVELREICEDLLNDMLRSWALEFKYPQLSKQGTPTTLNAGSRYITLFSDYGAGMDNLVFDTSPMVELDRDTFVQYDGFRDAVGRPQFYMVDEESQRLVFGRVADKNYTVLPFYYKIPAALTLDTEKPWFKDDKTIVQGLIAEIYQYTEDPRENAQFQKVEFMMKKIRGGIVAMGGGPKKIPLSSTTFPLRSRLGYGCITRF